MKNLWVFIFLISTNFLSGAVKAEAGCDSCVKINDIILRNDVDAAASFMSKFTFSKDPSQVQSEAYDISRMAAKFIPEDRQGDVDEFYYSIYNKNPQAMSLARNRVSTKEKAILEKSYKETDRVRKNGNGRRDQTTDQKVAECDKSTPPAHNTNLNIPVLGSIAKALTTFPSAVAAGFSGSTDGTSSMPSKSSTPTSFIQKNTNSRGPASLRPTYYEPVQDEPTTASEAE